MDKDTALASIASCAALLEQHAKIHWLSVATTLIATAILLAAPMLPGPLSSLWLLAILSVIAVGLAEVWFAVRVGFDHVLLTSVVISPDKLQDLDRALIGLKLMPASKAGRDLDERLRGVVRLLKYQAALLCTQLAVAVIAGLLARLYG